MAHHSRDTHVLCTLLLAIWFARATEAYALSGTNVESQLQALKQQNETLQNQLRQQQEVIDALRRDVAGIRQANEQRVADTTAVPAPANEPAGSFGSSIGGYFGKVQLSGEGAAGLFETGSQGFSPNAEFRMDEARLFIDAQAWNDVYAYAELNLTTREYSGVYLGEAYIDVEDVSKLWGREGQLNVRIGRMYIPFGEEYMTRYAIDNPLISRSLSDLWGYDEGVEVYGTVDKLSYVVAVQNGGGQPETDFTADKSVAGRLSFDPNRHLHFSVSGMRTGDLTAQGDVYSAMWFSEGYFVPLGTSTLFHANLAEVDARWNLLRGYVKAFGGYIRYDDDENNGRNMYYYAVEAVHDLTRKLYAAARFSQIFATEGGYPIVANGSPGEYWVGPTTDQIWRLSLGLGYRWDRNFILKSEYSIERGKEPGGENRDHEDMFAAEVAFGF